MGTSDPGLVLSTPDGQTVLIQPKSVLGVMRSGADCSAVTYRDERGTLIEIVVVGYPSTVNEQIRSAKAAARRERQALKRAEAAHG